MKTSARLHQNELQRHYFEDVERSRLALADTPYVHSHVDRAIAAGRFATSDALLEIGAGLGKFTLPLLARGFDVTANDLSPVLLERLRSASVRPVRTVACDVVEVERFVETRFNGIVGFFVLHHLVDFDGTFRALARVLEPGGRIAFCEPVAWNPLYYLQIALTPGMRFSGEPSLTAMRPGRILPAMRRAGLVDARSQRYGYFPPFLKNTAAGDRLEQWMERQTWVPVPRAFQVFTARAEP